MIAFIRKYFVMAVSILLGLLFMYAAMSKMLDFENFQVQLAQSPLLSAYAGFVSYAVITIEILVSVALCLKSFRYVALFASLALMVAFTVYIYLILNYSEFIPCSCGGILEKLGWKEHLIFNIFFVVLTSVAIFFLAKYNRQNLWRTLLMVSCMTVLSTGVVVSMFLSSEHIIKKENNFTRRFLLHPVIADRRLDLKMNSYYFAGSADDVIYLGNKTAPLVLTAVDLALRSTSVQRVSLDQSNYPFRNLQLKVKGKFFYLFDGTVPIIYRGQLGNSSAVTISYKDAYFTQLAVLDSTKFAIRVQKSTDNEYAIASLNLNDNPKLMIRDQILQKQIDGVFDVDGLLRSTADGKKQVYTYAYRNQFIVLDSSLKIINRLNTIDTTSRAKISVKQLKNGSNKMSAPPFSVNKGSAIFENLLFNLANLKGKFEPKDIWKYSTVIDVYRTDMDKYIGSFTIEHRNGLAMSDIMVQGQYLFVLLGNEMIRYRIRKNVFR
ncbi:MauE/DoxX family redox-associated membrane protein [Chryseobacterium culicis]|uniref:MauE/DoxX family redox-associated membrane protein n=1 Tax=Chryseobacterium culicis TaxID=680127 RepID=UPI002898208D|nr:MauE/DoxX family redox-associated membrane protein [Chryseobacterium culicis]